MATGEMSYKEKKAAIRKFIYGLAKKDHKDEEYAEWVYQNAVDAVYGVRVVWGVMQDEKLRDTMTIGGLNEIILHADD